MQPIESVGSLIANYRKYEGNLGSRCLRTSRLDEMHHSAACYKNFGVIKLLILQRLTRM